MSNLEITSNKIVSLLSDHWLSLDSIAERLKITEPLDKKYLGLKLKELNRNGALVYIWHNYDVYWKVTKPEFEFEDEETSSFNLHTDFYLEFLDNKPDDIEGWERLGYWYGSFERFDNANKESGIIYPNFPLFFSSLIPSSIKI